MSIRLFLMLCDADGNWSVSVHREFESVLAEWNGRARPQNTAGVLHVGFDRPPSKAFETIIKGQWGHLLVTGSAKYALPEGFKSAQSELGRVGELPVFLGTRGWGYVVEGDSCVAAPTRGDIEYKDWVLKFSQVFPEDAQVARSLGIFDESSYLLLENHLDERIRIVAGKFRTKSALGDTPYDLCELARAAPPWLANRPFSTIDIPVRATGVFENAGIATVADLGASTLANLLKLPNFGRKTASDVLLALERALSEGPYVVEAKLNAAVSVPLIASIRLSLADSSERERDIVFRRMGLERAAETLQKIGDDYRLTRERVRQIEAKAVGRMIRKEYWDDILTSKLQGMLKGRQFPMPVMGMEAVDSWFEGVGDHIDVLRYVLENVCTGEARVITVDGVEYCTFISQDAWDRNVSRAKRLLASGVGEQWTRDHCRFLVDGILPEKARELRSVIWEKASQLCHFVENANGDHFLTSYGRGAEQFVEAILCASETPLHFSEIAARASEKAGRVIDARRAHNAAAEVGYLLGPGTFGVERHLPVQGPALEALGEEAAEIVQAGTPGRQWHTSEIFAALLERGRVGKDTDKYVLDVALQRSGGLERLGRMVWADTSSGSSRIDVRQAILTLIKNAGRPLRTTEIRQRLVAVRGVNQSFQIMPFDPIIRVAPSTWGLNDRDIPVKRKDQPKIISALVEVLAQRMLGVHITELNNLDLSIPREMAPEAIFSLAAADVRLRVDVSQYLFLAEWGDARRESIRDAVNSVLASAVRPLSFDDIVTQVFLRVGRDFPRNAISGCLQSLSAIHDPATGLWSPGESENYLSEDEEDDEPKVFRAASHG